MRYIRRFAAAGTIVLFAFTTAKAQLGSVGVGAHDPSTIVKDGGEYWVFYTGRGIPSYHSIEASDIYYHDEQYFLFVNWGRCCRRTNSTYNIRVGRSTKMTGPYFDKSGQDMMHDGGTLLLATEGDMIGPGHAGILREADKYWLSFHFYDGGASGASKLAIRPLTWDADGWPMISDVAISH